MTVKDLNLKVSGEIEKKAAQLEETDYERFLQGGVRWRTQRRNRGR